MVAIRALSLAVSIALGTTAASAEAIKIGFISTFSGPAAFAGDYAEKGVQLFLDQNPAAFGGHEIKIIKRDDTGPNADVSRRLAQELIVRDGVDVIMGLHFTPNAFAVLDIADKARVPVIIQNAATASITEASPYVVRVSRTLWGSAYPLGQYATKKLGAKTAVVMYSDYAPGKDAKDAFERAFTEGGGEVLDRVALPFPQTPDFTPFLQRVKSTDPDVLFAFVPSGKYSTAFVKTYETLGLKTVTRLIGPFDIAPPAELELMGAGIEGALVVGHYSESLDNPANKAFTEAWHAKYGDLAVDSFAVQAYDSMAAIAEAVRKTDGSFDGESFVEALKGWRFDSARGPLTIDAETRDAVQNQYVIEIRADARGKLGDVVIDTIPNVKDPWKELGLGKK